jgi:hypothetical protein
MLFASLMLLMSLPLPDVAACDFLEIVSAAAVDPFAADVPAAVNDVTSLTAIAGVLVIADVSTLLMFLLFLLGFHNYWCPCSC